jgi:hypothetical protein
MGEDDAIHNPFLLEEVLSTVPSFEVYSCVLVLSTFHILAALATMKGYREMVL